ncbi:copper-translocating P-type ATPase [Candidatus Daviesbacteria bacterium]|nr:copper-translocating P-type ATPase [Candidatus Daviesbacteria bacterium]
MHQEIQQEIKGRCPKCGMDLVLNEKTDNNQTHRDHSEHQMKPVSEMSFWEKTKMGMTMAMGMEHGGLAGREMAKLMEEDIRNKFFFSLVFTIPIVLYSSLGQKILGFSLPSPIPNAWLLFLLTTPVFFYAGWIFLYSTYKALQAKTLNMAVLIAVGITAAYGFSIVLTFLGSNDSYYEAAAMLITFVLFGHWMEMKSRRGTTDALAALFNLVPPQARILRNSREELVSTSEIKPGDILILKPGDKVPVDGEIIEGETSIDESLVTGESIPIEKKTGDFVIGGSINESGSVKFKATKVGQDTVLSQIVKMVELAQNSKAPGQKIADKFAQYLVILAVGGGLVTFFIWFFIMGQPLLFALTFAISAVVIACPDALGLATPTAVAVGTSLGAKHNILIKDAPTLEQVSKIQAVVLDKTGTLTEGKPKVTDFLLMDGIEGVEAELGFKKPKGMDIKTYILSLVVSLEKGSEHALSKAIISFGMEKRVKEFKVEKFQAVLGLGVTGVVDGEKVAVGTRKLMEKEGVMRCGELDKKADQFVAQAKTLAFVGIDGKNVAILAIADGVKDNAKIAIQKMQELGLEVAMITGDNQKTAEVVGKELGIKRIFAEVLPDEKAEYIKKLQGEGKFVAMVGDGINDAPALAQADIGIAIGAGTDVAIETAKVVLMKSDPADVLRAIKLSKATVIKMKQNLFWASIYNLLAIPIAAGVLYPKFGIELRPEFSALLMSASSIIVATNAVLLNRAEKDLISV